MNGHLCCYTIALKKVLIVLATWYQTFKYCSLGFNKESLSPDDYEITEKFEMVSYKVQNLQSCF